MILPTIITLISLALGLTPGSSAAFCPGIEDLGLPEKVKFALIKTDPVDRSYYSGIVFARSPLPDEFPAGEDADREIMLVGQTEQGSAEVLNKALQLTSSGDYQENQIKVITFNASGGDNALRELAEHVGEGNMIHFFPQAAPGGVTLPGIPITWGFGPKSDHPEDLQKLGQYAERAAREMQSRYEDKREDPGHLGSWFIEDTLQDKKVLKTTFLRLCKDAVLATFVAAGVQVMDRGGMLDPVWVGGITLCGLTMYRLRKAW